MRIDNNENPKTAHPSNAGKKHLLYNLDRNNIIIIIYDWPGNIVFNDCGVFTNILTITMYTRIYTIYA